MTARTVSFLARPLLPAKHSKTGSATSSGWAIFSRSAEQCILRGLIGIAAGMDAQRLLGEYIPTPRNDLVAALYRGLGFLPVDAGSLFVRDIGAGVDDLVTYVTDAA
jgi:hypothetical protein